MPRTTTPKKAASTTTMTKMTATTGTTSSKAESQKQKTSKSTPTRTTSTTSKSAKPHCISDSLDVILPLSLGKSTMDCTVLVQIDPDDSRNLDFEGTAGAIGRFHVNQQGLILDLKGNQYHGHLLPGPTVMVASLWYDEQHDQQLRLETITDEFCHLHKTQDTMAKLDARVLKGELDDSYRLQEEDVNVSAKKQEQMADQQAKKQQQKKKKTTAAAATTKTPKKRKASTDTSATTTSNNKKAKTTVRKGTKK